MTIEELQKAWHSVKSEPRSHDELRAMMYSTRSPRMRRLQRKEILHLFLYLSLVAAVTLAFRFYKDWSTGIMIPVAVLEVLDEYLGLRYVRWLPQKGTIEKTLLSHLKKLKLALLLSRLVHVTLWTALVVVVGINLQLGFWNAVLLGSAAVPVVFLLTQWSSRKWSQKVKEVNELLKEADEEPEMPVGA